MQELLEWIRATLPMDLETPQMIEQKIESMLEKEKEQIMGVWIDAYTTNMKAPTRDNFTMWANNYYNETFNINNE